MELTINGYRGIDYAKIEIPENEITILAGENHAGKSSIVEALQGLTLADVDFFGKKKAERERKINHGATGCDFQLRSKTGTRCMSLPKGDIRTPEGRGLNSEPFALGLSRLTALNGASRAECLEKYLKSAPDRTRTAAALQAINAPQNKAVHAFHNNRQIILDTIFGTEKLPARGWKAGEDFCDNQALELKRIFKSDTGIQWGSDQGATFTPQGWEPDLNSLTQADLQKELVSARESLERAIAENALSERDREQLENLAADHDKFAKELATWHAKIAELEKEPVAGVFTTCSGCGLKGHVKAGKLVAADTAKQAQIQNAKFAAKLAEDNYKKAVSAKAKLEKLGPSDGKAIDDARAALARAEVRLRARKTKDRGNELHAEIVAYTESSKLLAADGLRKRMLVAALDPFNEHLAKLCYAAGWKQVKIDKDLEIFYGDEWYLNLSTSEKYRTDATLQIAFAQMEKAQLVTFDEAQMLDRPGRNQLINLLRAVKITAVIAMTTFVEKEGRKIVPDLRKAKCGVTYWIEGGKVNTFVETGVAVVRAQAVTA